MRVRARACVEERMSEGARRPASTTQRRQPYGQFPCSYTFGRVRVSRANGGSASCHSFRLIFTNRPAPAPAQLHLEAGSCRQNVTIINLGTCECSMFKKQNSCFMTESMIRNTTLSRVRCHSCS